jgi:hypothetical protein
LLPGPFPFIRWRLRPSDQAADKGYKEQNEEQVEQQLRNSRSRNHDSGEAKYTRDNRYDQENQRPTQHAFFLPILELLPFRRTPFVGIRGPA